MYSLKSVSSKLLTVAFAFVFAVSCGTVTDANVDLPEAEEPTITTTTLSDDFFWNSNGDDMDPIIRRPQTGGSMN